MSPAITRIFGGEFGEKFPTVASAIVYAWNCRVMCVGKGWRHAASMWDETIQALGELPQ